MKANPQPVHPMVADLRAARIAAGMTLAAVAAAMEGDIALQQVSHWEMGRSSPSLAGLTRWAAVFGLRPDLVSITSPGEGQT